MSYDTQCRAIDKCRRDGCTRPRTKYSVYCDEHHQEQLRRVGLDRPNARPEDASDDLAKGCRRLLRQREAGLISDDELLSQLYDRFVHSGTHGLLVCWEPCFSALPAGVLSNLLAFSKSHRHVPRTFGASYVSDARREAAKKTALDIQARLVQQLEAYLARPS